MRAKDETLLRCGIDSVDRNIMDFDHEALPVLETKVFFGDNNIGTNTTFPHSGGSLTEDGEVRSEANGSRSDV
jgi:hypothetical protein